MRDPNIEPKGIGAGTLILSFLGGATVGAAAALLLAPRSGEATRRRIKDVVTESGQRIKDVATDTGQRISRVPEAINEATGVAARVFAETLKDQHVSH